ncbi:MAG: PAS domain-containing sensor histidine kinase [Candidatus Thorarchaeota archaeon]|nr:PAS domain-containing sensor histidine kinase [Candidatus Thorarchaeota archaeon]
MENLQLIVSLIEGTNDLIHSIQADESMEFVNRSWLETMGYSHKDIETLKTKDYVFPGQIRKYQELVKEIFRGKTKKDVQVTFVTKNGDLIETEGNMFPRQEGGKVVAAVGFFRDVTEKMETKKRLQEAKADTEFFVDLMVHDIANIHQELLSALEILLFNREMPSEIEAIVKESLAELERGSDLISNVRKLTRLYKEALETREKDLASSISISAKNVERSFPEKKLLLRMNIEPGDFVVRADEYLEDVFFGLLHNSMKFDEKNEVEVDMQIEAIKHTPFLKIQIKDHGPGIRDEEKESVFARFAHRRESVMGLGLGLTLVRKILENYGAYIRVEDRVEGDHTKGANFVILMRYEELGSKRIAKEVEA